VDDITREVAELEVRELVKGSFLEDAKIIPTSGVTGMGLEEPEGGAWWQLSTESHRLGGRCHEE